MVKDICVILCQFREDGGGLVPFLEPPNFYESYFFGQVGGGLGDYYGQVTNSQVNLAGNVLGWLDIGHTRAEHNSESGSAQRERAYNWGLAGAALPVFQLIFMLPVS